MIIKVWKGDRHRLPRMRYAELSLAVAREVLHQRRVTARLVQIAVREDHHWQLPAREGRVQMAVRDDRRVAQQHVAGILPPGCHRAEGRFLAQIRCGGRGRGATDRRVPRGHHQWARTGGVDDKLGRPDHVATGRHRERKGRGLGREDAGATRHRSQPLGRETGPTEPLQSSRHWYDAQEGDHTIKHRGAVA